MSVVRVLPQPQRARDPGPRRQTRTKDKDDRGYGLPLVTTDLTSSPEELVARYAARWCIEVAFSDARQTLGVGQTRNRLKKAVERTVPFAMICLSLVTVWYATAGHTPNVAAERRARSPWYRTKTEPSFEDMTIKLRRVIIAARFRAPRPDAEVDTLRFRLCHLPGRLVRHARDTILRIPADWPWATACTTC